MILALDTSGGELLVCLVSDDGDVAAGVLVPGRRHQEVLLETVEEVVGGRQGMATVSGLAVVRGPGSQTGLRVGLAAAEGLAFASRLPVLPLSSLAVAAHRVAVDGPVIAAVSAGRRNVYAQLYEARGPRRVILAARVLAAAADARARLGAPPSVPVGAETAVVTALGSAPPLTMRPGIEALAEAVGEAAGEGAWLAYHQLTGDYGE